MNNLYFLKKDCINKNLLVSYFLISFLKSICVEVNVFNLIKLNKDSFLKSISLLEILTNQKVFLKTKKIVLNNKTKQSSFNFYLKCNLRKNLILNFLGYLNYFLLSELKNSYSFFNYTGNLFNYKFKLKNIMIIRILKSNFLIWMFSIYISFEFSNNHVVPLIYNSFLR